MKTHSNDRRSSAGLTFIEVIGSLAVITMLAALLAPRVTEAIHDAHVAAEVTTLNHMKTAVEAYYRQYGKLAGAGGGSVTFTQSAYNNWDRDVLVREGLLEREFDTHLGQLGYLRLTPVNPSATADPLTSGNRGGLGTIYCNNGVYDLTQEYSAVASPGDLEFATASGSKAGRWVASGIAASLFRNPSMVSLLAAASPAVRGHEWFSADGVRQSLGASQGVAALRGLLSSTSIHPLEACYPLPNNLPKPTPTYGSGGSGPGKVSSSRPSARNDAHAGAVVAEV
ncbi:MAG: type IV pilin protein, partial [Limisphaerales bacterium]